MRLAGDCAVSVGLAEVASGRVILWRGCVSIYISLTAFKVSRALTTAWEDC